MSFPRYPKYKASGVEWLGNVPENWDIGPYKHLIEIQNGADHKQVEAEDGYPVIGSGGVFAYAKDFMYEGESVLLGRKGTIDRPLHVSGRFWTVDTMYWSKIRPDVSGRFAYYTATTIPFDYYSTSTALPSMTKNALGNHRLAIPSFTEQASIASFLDRETSKIDGLVGEQRRLIELLKEKRQAVISHAVTKGLNPNAPLKPSGIEWLGDVPEHWKVIQMKRVATIRYGIGEPPRYHDEGIPLVRATNVHAGRLFAEGMVFVDSREIPEQRIVWLATGDIIVVRSGAYTGDSAIIPDGFGPSIAGFDMVLKCHSAHAPFIQYSLLSKYLKEGQIDLEKMRAAQPHLNAEELGSCVLVMPDTDEQTAIVAFLNVETAKLDALTAEAERGIELLQERRTALISAAVTGKIDVRGLVKLES
jgi:type I restriction enzyme S subunit